MSPDPKELAAPQELVAQAIDLCHQMETVLKAALNSGVKNAQREQLLAPAEPLLEALQLAVNRQARLGQLGPMRELTSERNALLELVSRLKRAPAAGSGTELATPAVGKAVVADPEKAVAAEKKRDAAKQLAARAAILAEVEAKEARRARLWRWSVFSTLIAASIALAIFKGFVVNREEDPRVATGNHAPVVKSLQIEETAFAVVAKVKIDDAEGEATRLTVEWYVDGQRIIGVNGLELPRRAYDGGQSVYLIVTPLDGIGAGRPKRSPTLTVSGGIKKPPAGY